MIIVKFKISICIFAFSYVLNANCQTTPEELGNLTFNAFQKDSIENFFKLVPNFTELKKFGETIGADSIYTQSKEFEEKYPMTLELFKAKCLQILNESLETKSNWKNTHLNRIETKEKEVVLNNLDPKSKKVIITIVDIHFTVNSKDFILRLGDAYKYGAVWKPGNNIELIQNKNSVNGS